MPFSEVARTYDETRKRSSTEYAKFTDKYRVVLRMLNPNPLQVWKHWIPEANGGRGLGAVCPNTDPKLKVCPIEKQYEHLPKEDKERRDHNARRKFVINVLDRTPVTNCKQCETVTPAVTNVASGSKQCQSCGADLKGHDFSPLNKVKILEGGPRLFNESLNAIADMQKADIGAEITEYDIVFTTQGEGRERKVTPIPKDPEPISDEDLLDSETGEPQKLFDLSLLGEPASIEEIELMLQGATIDQLNAVRGIE